MKRKFCHYGWKERNCVLPTGDSEISSYFSLWMGRSLCISLYAKIPFYKHSQLRTPSFLSAMVFH